MNFKGLMLSEQSQYENTQYDSIRKTFLRRQDYSVGSDQCWEGAILKQSCESVWGMMELFCIPTVVVIT